MKKTFEKELVTAESRIEELWYKEAQNMTIEKLEEFVSELPLPKGKGFLNV